MMLGCYVFYQVSAYYNQTVKIQMSKLLLILSLAILSRQLIMPGFPDAIACASPPYITGAIYFAHGITQSTGGLYCQVYADESRCVHFNADGSYKSGNGYYEIRKGCQNKSIATLKKQGRTFDLTMNNSTIITSQLINLRSKTTELEQEIEMLKKKQLFANFWDYEQIKQKWMKEFQKMILNSIKSNGLQIGSRWIIRQQWSGFIIRDLQGSKKKDSRIFFPPNEFKNP